MTELVWHPHVIGPDVERALRTVAAESLPASGFYLAGGTGLALQLEHRRSHDLDFFTAEAFQEEGLLMRLQSVPGFSIVSKDRQTLHVTLHDVRTSFFQYVYPVLFPTPPFLDVPVADRRDIACMKIAAIAGRGTKRDFVDLHAVATQEGLEGLLASFRRKFAQARYSIVHVLKSLTYFDDAELDPMPDMLAPTSWDAVKDYFRHHAPRLV